LVGVGVVVGVARLEAVRMLWARVKGK
jgi:hypothetical protein